MPYSKQTWTDGSSSTPVSAARLTNIENGIFNAQDMAEDWIPWRQTVFGYFPPNLSVSGTWGSNAVSAQVFDFIGMNQSNAQNNEFRWNVPLSIGTWQMYVLSDQDPQRAIATWEISYNNGSTWNSIGTHDGYVAAGSAAANISYSYTITVPSGGVQIIRLRNPTRNASATGWYMSMTMMDFVRTA